ncbi:MAG: hypothetical protein MRY59_01885 [Aquisalinus sp.]|nr:hypothetical protein [Aquisalinus sp.]
MIGRFQRTVRLIPPDYLEAVAGQPGRTYENLKGKADTYAKIDNSPQRGQPRRVIEGEGGRAARVLRAELERSADLAGSGSGGRGGRGSADEAGPGQGPEGDALLIGDGPSADITDEIRRADAMLQRFDGCVKR